MPRTTLKSDQDDSISESNGRGDAEQAHWRQQEWQFRWPFAIKPSRILWLAAQTMDRVEKTLDQLVPEEARKFCFKDCAIYVVSTGSGNQPLMAQLYDKIYRYWYPSRAEDTDLSHGNFFCHVFGYANHAKSTSPPTVKEVVDFHSSMCHKLDELIPQMADDIPLRPWQTAVDLLLLPPAVYKLRPTFKECFLVIHAEHNEHNLEQVLKERGVTIVWTNENNAIRHGCVADPEKGISVEDTGDIGQAQAFRCRSLECAMRLVLSTDPQRSPTKKERHERYTVEGIDCLDQLNPTPVEGCRCTGCRPDLYRPDIWPTGTKGLQAEESMEQTVV